MELDVHLTREGEEPWGFEFVGGADYPIPLTIDKVFPSSPADVAGLQPGDVVARLGDKLATELSQEAAVAIVLEAVGSLSFGICRGLYDPVLDDFEPIYEPIDRADSDLRSEPTEVQFPIQQFEPNGLSLDALDPSLFDSGYDTRPLTESRSLTASPFVPNSKPYRPFSTEPLEVPPLDDPIILNPNYKDLFNFKDQFGNAKVLDPKEEDLLRLIPLEKNIESKFKLPVSEKFDPEWDKKVAEMLEKCAEGGRRETQHVEHELVYYAGNASDIKSTAVNATKEVRMEEVKISKEVKIQEAINVESIQEKTKTEVKFDEKMKEELSMKTIEQTALEVVEESIERAVSVAEDIQKEVDVELRASMTKEMQAQETEVTSEMKTHFEEVESKMERKESVVKSEMNETLDETKHESHTEIKVTDEENILDEKLIKDQQFVEERRLSNRKEMEEIIENGIVKRKSSVFVKDGVSFSETGDQREQVTEERKLSTQQELEEAISEGTVKRKSMVFEQENDVLPNTKEATRKFSHVEERKSEFKSSESINGETLQSEGKQRAYMIGLQTIPHIKGFVQSSYHFDLLLRTFFVHLTDVMVALSRFILTQPATELESKAEQVIKEKLIKEFASKGSEQYERREAEERHEKRKQSVQVVKQDKIQESNIRQEQKLVQAKQETKMAKAEVTKDTQQIKTDIRKSEDMKVLKEIVKNEQTSKIHESSEISLEEVERRKKSGAEMAQMTQRKSKDLTKKMDAVITEFETKTGMEDRLEVTEQSRRRSRSRSQIEQEVMKESDPLEWLDKVDSRRASQERTDVTSVKKEFSASSESKASSRSETKRESTKVKPGKQMYIAIVESHVYTNKDAILEDQVAEMSETASVQSSEEINTALESLETISTENVAMRNLIQTDEKQQAAEVITNALQEVVQEKQEVLEAVSDFKSQITEQHLKSVVQESHTSVAAESTEIISQPKVEAFKTQELKQHKAVAVQEESYKTAAVEFVDVPLEATKEVVIESKASKQEAVAKQEVFATVAAESTEIITDETKLESFKAKEMVTNKAVISTEENYKTTALSTAEVLLEASKEETAELKVSKQQAVAKVESHAIAVAQSTDVVVDDSKLESFESKELVSKKAIVASEETYKTAAVGTTEVTYEEAAEQHSEQAKTSQVTIKEEAQHLAVAGIIETKTELCKEPKKPAEDEYASLKIIKEEVIDGGESVQIIAESELNVQNNLEVAMSSSQQVQSLVSQSKESSQSISQEMSKRESLKSAELSKLHIRTDLAQQVIRKTSQASCQSDENNNTPSPTPLPPTPLTDEYIFKLEIPLPKNQGTIVVEESPDREDPHIVKKGLVPHIETTIEEQIIYDPPLPTPPEDKVQSPVYTKPGLKGGAEPLFRKEYIREIERKSSLLASAIDQTIKSIEEYKEEVGIDTRTEFTIQNGGSTKLSNGLSNGHQRPENNENVNELSEGKVGNENGTTEVGQEESLPGFKPVVFNPEAYQAKLYDEVIRDTFEPEHKEVKIYLDESGEPLGTIKGIVDGLEDAVVDEEVAKGLGKPGLTEDKIAELISGESEMLREAHVMGLSRVLNSHMNRADDSSVDFQKIKPLVESLKDSEVLKALNEELLREKTIEKKKDEKKWTTFLQKPKRPVPRAKFGYLGCVEPEEVDNEEPYRVKIVKQPKPKVAPDYKPEDFDTGPLPWEQRALIEPVPSPVPPEEPILIPEETPEFLEAVDPLPESEVPDLEDTGIPLPEEPLPPPEEPLPPPELPPDLPPEPPEPEVEEPPIMHDMEQNKMAEQLVNSVRSMVDPNAPLEQQLAQMRAQLATLAQLPCVIQQSLETLTRQLSSMTHQENQQMSYENHQEENAMETIQEYQVEETQNNQEAGQNNQEQSQNNQEQNSVTIEEVQEQKPMLTAEEYTQMKREEDAIVEEQRRSEKEKKERQEQMRLELESRQIKQRAPRVGKPKQVFGRLSPEDRPLVLPGGRRWRGPDDAYNEQMIAETLQAQSELLLGKVMGYESDLLPYDDRINFMKYEKPPIALDHLQNSETYKLIHDMEQEPPRRVELLTPVMSEAEYRQRCQSAMSIQTNGHM